MSSQQNTVVEAQSMGIIKGLGFIIGSIAMIFVNLVTLVNKGTVGTGDLTETLLNTANNHAQAMELDSKLVVETKKIEAQSALDALKA